MADQQQIAEAWKTLKDVERRHSAEQHQLRGDLARLLAERSVSFGEAAEVMGVTRAYCGRLARDFDQGRFS